MQKSLRSFALVAALALTIAPAALADQTGCNPHPQKPPTPPKVQVAVSSSVLTFVNVALSLLGA